MKKNHKELYQSYIDHNDITERNFAHEHFGSLEAWYVWAEKNEGPVAKWRKELELKLKGEMYSLLIDTARSHSKESVGAAKFLLGKGVLTRAPDAVDSPSEAEIRDYATKAPKAKVESDYIRLMVNNA